MKITWLGQAGLLFETGGLTIVIDPYLSNSCQRLNPDSFRRVPVDERFLKLKPDVIICTHNHQDHYDEETLRHYLTGEKAVTCLVAPSCFASIRQYGAKHNYIWFAPHTRWTQDGVCFFAVRAVHSDSEAVGVILEAEDKRYYITGDTLYNTDIFADIPENLEAVFLPVNGVGNNMNMTDALDFAEQTGARKAVPLHRGMLDDLDFAAFTAPNAVIPEIYKEIRL